MSESGPGRREVAYRLFAAEFDDSDLSYSESDEERAPNYVVTPTGARVNRLFAVGVLTEVEDVNPEMVRGRVVDPTGAFVTYAGQYQPDALAFLDRTEPPTFLALSGKARTYEPEDGDRIYTSVRPESVSEVDAETRDRWIVTAAERTVERIGITASAIESGLSGEELKDALTAAGVDDRLAEGVALALDHYGTTPAYLEALRELAIDAVRVVAGEREEVDRLELAPDEGAGDASSLAALELPDVDTTSTGADPPDSDGEESVPTAGTALESSDEPAGVTDTGPAEGSETGATSGTEPDPGVEETGSTAGAPSEGPASDDGPTPEESETSEPAVGAGRDESSTEPSFDDTEPVEEEPDDFDPGEFELDESERREVEEEFGTDFSTAGEVEPVDPDSDDGAAIGSDTALDDSGAETAESEVATREPKQEPEAEPEREPEPEAEAEREPKSDTADEADVDLTDAVMEAMERLDEGDGADRETLVETVIDEHGVTEPDVEETIQEALMGGRCYEPSDGTLKSI